MARRFVVRSLGFLTTLAFASPALAHVRMDYPISRYPDPGPGGDVNQDIKDGPCGRANDARTTDPSRITTLEAGSTITVEFRETIRHSGWHRIAFLEDGQDFPAPPTSGQAPTTATGPILLDGIPDGERGMTYTAEITLPNTPCSNCTLQLIQVMTDRNPYESYYTCADIVLTAGDGSGGTAGSGGSGGSDANGGSAGATGGAGGAASGGSGGSASGAGGVFGGAGTGGGGGSGIVPVAGVGGTPGASGAGGSAGSDTGGTPGGAGTQPAAGTSTSGGAPSGAGTGSGGTGSNAGGAPSAPAASDTEEAAGCSIAPGRTTTSALSLLGLGLFADFAVRRRRSRARD